MAVTTNTITVPNIGAAGGNREDLSDILYNVVPTATPLTTAAGRSSKATNFYHEWMQEDLNAANANNAAIDGDAAVTYSPKTPSERVGNRIQIFTKVVSISDGEEAVQTAGNAYKMAHETANKILEIKRDMETAFLSNNASVAATDSVAGKLGGLQAWLKTNVNRGAGGTNGGFTAGTVAAGTPGTARAFSETQLKAVMELRFQNAGMANGQLLAFMPGTVKVQFSTFTGISINRVQNPNLSRGAKITGSVEVYMSDFGDIVAVPHPYGFGTDKTCLIVDPEYVGISSLIGLQRKQLARTGTAEQKLLESYTTLEVKNEKAHAGVFGLQ